MTEQAAPARELQGYRPVFELPITLSDEAIRQAFVATGSKPSRSQFFQISDLTELPLEARERLVDVWEQIDLERQTIQLQVDEDEFVDDEFISVRRYGSVYRAPFEWHGRDTNEQPIPLAAVLRATPGRTISLLEWLRDELNDVVPLDAMLDGAPLVQTTEKGKLTLDAVLSAYEEALGLAARIGDELQDWVPLEEHDPFTDSALRFDAERIVFFDARERRTGRSFGLLRESDPAAFDKALATVKALREAASPEIIKGFVKDLCEAMDRARITNLDIPDHALADIFIAGSAKRAMEQANSERARHELDERLRAEMVAWIEQNGSDRVRAARNRGYRYDGIYRDERLAEDLPGFVAFLGKGAKVRPVVNPSAEALAAEAETIERIEHRRLGEAHARIVWVVTDHGTSLPTGEYIQVSDYLGRYTVYLQAGTREDDDIPF